MVGSAIVGLGAANPAQANDGQQYIRFEQVVHRWAMNVGQDRGTTSSDATVQLWSWTHRDPHDWNSQWSWQHLGGEYYQYRNRWSGLCLDVSSPSLNARLVQNPCDASDLGQHWDDVLAGHYNRRQAYTLRNRALTERVGLPMSAAAVHVNQGASVQLKAPNLAITEHRWYFSYVQG